MPPIMRRSFAAKVTRAQVMSAKVIRWEGHLLRRSKKIDSISINDDAVGL